MRSTFPLLDRSPAQDDALLDTLVGARQPAHLTLEDFAHVADADFLVRLLHGAATTRACGVNILVHGPPGTGKTELARTLADAAGLDRAGRGLAEPRTNRSRSCRYVEQRLFVFADR